MHRFVKGIYIYLVAIMIFTLVMPANIALANSFKTKAESAIVVDFETGKILYSKKADEALPPASMTKMMTEYIVLEKVKNGDINWDTTTEISDFVFEISANKDFSGIGLRKNVEYTVKELFDAMVINSDNATSIALAELIAGSEGEFVKLMNEKATELGLTDSKFVNSSGLDNESLNGKHPEGTEADDTNLLSARDAAKLAYHLINDFPESLETSSIPTKKFEGHLMTNWNWMLPHDSVNFKQFYYEGVDGLKTGHTKLAKYAFTSTAERDGVRLITVVMKTESIEERFLETAKLLDYGFSQFEELELFPKGYKKEGESVVPVVKGKEENVEVALDEAISLKIRNGTEDDYDVMFELDESVIDEDGALIAPIAKGDKVGKAILMYKDSSTIAHITDEDKAITVDVVATEDVEKKNWFSLMLGGIGNFFAGLGTKIKNIF